MDDERKQDLVPEEPAEEEPEKHEDFRKVRSAKAGLTFRLLGIGVVLYWMMEVVVAFFKGGPDAPSLGITLLSVLLMGGGSAAVGVLTWKVWKLDKAEAQMDPEEIARMAALRAVDEDEEEEDEEIDPNP